MAETPVHPGAVHPTAVVDPKAVLGPGVHIGPYAVVGPRVTLASWRASIIQTSPRTKRRRRKNSRRSTRPTKSSATPPIARSTTNWAQIGNKARSSVRRRVGRDSGVAARINVAHRVRQIMSSISAERDLVIFLNNCLAREAGAVPGEGPALWMKNSRNADATSRAISWSRSRKLFTVLYVR